MWATVYVAIFGAPALLALTSASSLQLILAPVGLKHWQAGLIVLGVIIVLGQVRCLCCCCSCVAFHAWQSS